MFTVHAGKVIEFECTCPSFVKSWNLFFCFLCSLCNQHTKLNSTFKLSTTKIVHVFNWLATEQYQRKQEKGICSCCG